MSPCHGFEAASPHLQVEGLPQFIPPPQTPLMWEPPALMPFWLFMEAHVNKLVYIPPEVKPH